MKTKRIRKQHRPSVRVGDVIALKNTIHLKRLEIDEILENGYYAVDSDGFGVLISFSEFNENWSLIAKNKHNEK